MQKERVEIKNLSTLALRQDKQQAGFTLLEVMLATLIFSIVVSAVYMSFRVGMNAYRASDERKELLQEGRFTIQTLSRDLQCVYYMPETNYNQAIRRQLERLEQLRRQSIDEGISLDELIYKEFERRGGGGDDAYEEDPFDPYTWGIPIDLKFSGVNNGDTDSIEFVRHQYNDGIIMSEPWALERVKYFVKGDDLLREGSVIFQPPLDKEGNPVSTPAPPREVISQGVEKFDVKYGFFSQGEWREAEDWRSEERKYRNPMPELDPEAPDYQQRLIEERRKPADGLPGYVFIKMRLVNKEKGGRKMEFQSLIRLPSAQETHIPPKEEEEE